MSSPKNKRKFFISLISIILVILMVGSVIVGALTTVAGAASSSSLKNKLNGLKDQADDIAAKSTELQQEIASNASETQTIVEKKANIDQQIDMTRQQVENLNEQIQQYNLLIAAKQEELDQSTQREADLNVEYKQRLRAMEEAGKTSYWSILFKASSFTDLLDRIERIGEVARADQQMMEEMKAVSAEIASAKMEIEASKAENELAKADLAILQDQLDDQRAEADALITELSSKADELEEAYKTYDAMEDEVRQQILAVQKQYEDALSDEEAARKIEEARQNASSGSGAKPSNSGGFVSPLPGGSSYVSCAYGYRYHPIYGYYAMHSGVDLAAGAGTPIYAVKSGTVTVATYSSVNGYYVTLNHNDGFASLYAHMTNYVVSPGQTVSQGQLIGYVGSTGWSTGAHLHFEIFYGGANVNPMDYISV